MNTPNERPMIQNHKQAIYQCAIAGRMLSMINIPEMLKNIEITEAIGPLSAPSLYRDKSQALSEDKELLKAAFPLWRYVHENWRKEASG